MVDNFSISRGVPGDISENISKKEKNSSGEEKTSSSKTIFLFVVGERLVNGIAYSLTDDDLEVVGLGTAQSWDGESYSSFKEATTKTLGKHFNGEEKKVAQVIFVVSPFWTVSSEKLAEKKGGFLKSLCKDNGWPVGGFVIDDESLVFHFKTANEIPPSFISLFIQEKEFRISLVHLGKIKKRLRLNYQQLTPEEVKGGLEKLGFEGILPPKFIVWGNVFPELEELMVRYPWINQKGSLFLHLPDIQMVDWAELALIFKDIVATQMGKTLKTEEQLPVVGESKPEKKKFPREVVEDKETTLPSGFSFADLGEQQKKIEEEPVPALPEEKVSEARKTKSKFSWKQFFPTNNLLASSFKRLKGKTGTPFRFVLRSGLILKIVLLGIAVTAILWLMVIKRELILYVTPQEVVAKKDVVLVTNGSKKKDSLLARELSAEGEVSGEEVATGTRIIGEKAKGAVTVYNRTDDQASFAKGTVVAGPDGLEFIFSDEIKVASKTPDLTSGVDRWGEGEIQVEAAKVGADYNLAKDSIFTIEGKSEKEFLVKNKNSFEGGMSREVTAISENDVQRLKKTLTEQIREKMEDKLVKEKEEGEELLKETVETEIVSFSTDRSADEEGEMVSGSLKMSISGIAIKQENLVIFAREILTSQSPEDYQFDPQSVRVEFLPEEEKEGQWSGQLTVKGNFYPSIDTEQLVNQLRGRSKSLLLEKIKKQPRVYRYELKTFPAVFDFFPLLPYRKENITISLE